MEKIGNLLFVIMLSLVSTVSAAQAPKVSATVNRNEARVGQPIVYNIIVEGADSGSVGEPRLPDLVGFELVHKSQGMEARSEFVNGKFSFVRKQVYTYHLVPRKSGQLLIGRADVVVGEKSLATQPIRVDVRAAAPGSNVATQEPDVQDDTSDWDEADALFDQILKRSLPQVQKMPDINDKEAFFIRVEVDKKKVYAGEQVTATWYLYTQNNLTSFEPVKYPDLKGFWKEDIEIATRLNFETEIINGIPYRKALLVSYALFPIKAGVSTIDSYKLRASAIMSNPLSAFGKPYTFTKANPPVKLDVVPIPAQGQPSDFSGAVGQFRMSAKLDKSAVPANEPFSFKVRIEGRGNAKQIELPTLNLPSEFETFDTKADSKFFKDGTSFKEFEVLVIPRKEGVLTVPAIAMSYFNPATQKFERTETQPLTVKVGAGKALNLGGANPLDFSREQKVEKKLALPSPLLEPPKDFWTPQIAKFAYAGSTLAFVLALLFVGLKEFKLQSSKDELLQEVQVRLKIIQDSGKKGSYKDAGVSMMNLVDYVLSDMTKTSEAQSMDVLFDKIPPSLKNLLDESFQSAVRYFETLGFAPEEISKPLMNADRFDKEYKLIRKVLNESIKSLQTDV